MKPLMLVLLLIFASNAFAGYSRRPGTHSVRNHRSGLTFKKPKTTHKLKTPKAPRPRKAKNISRKDAKLLRGLYGY
jgi:hypothetical protein